MAQWRTQITTEVQWKAKRIADGAMENTNNDGSAMESTMD
jgi:hypothetical protein